MFKIACAIILDCNDIGFLEVPQSTVVAIETEAIFTCRHVSTDRVFWIINGTTSLDESCLPNITISSDSLPDSDITYSLTISGLATYNGTYVQCAVYVEVQPDRSIPATLLIQGWYLDCYIYTSILGTSTGTLHTFHLLMINIYIHNKFVGPFTHF